MTRGSRTSAPLHSRAILTAEERDMLATMAQNNPLKPFDQVAQETGLAPVLLRKLVRDGVLPGRAPWREPDVTGSCDIGEAHRLAAQLADARPPLEGDGSLPPEAGGKNA